MSTVTEIAEAFRINPSKVFGSGKVNKNTVKAFVRRNMENLHIANLSSFSGMTDGMEDCQDKSFSACTVLPEDHCRFSDNLCGINGAWTVGSSRDWFTNWETEHLVGFCCDNCVSRWIIAVEKSKLVTK